MPRVLKLAALILLLLLAAVVALAIYLTQFFDPNLLKPKLEELAREQGVELSMPGDVSWQWYPRLGLTLQDVQVGSGEPLLSIGSFEARVALRPLFKRQVVIEALNFDGLRVHLVVDESGAGNWEQLGSSAVEVADPDPDTAEATGETTSKLQLAVEQLRIREAVIDLQDRQAGTKINMRNLNLEIDHLNLSGEQFEVRQHGQLQLDDWPEMTLHTAAVLALQEDAQRLQIDKLDLQVRQDTHLIKLSASGQANLRESQIDLLLQAPVFDLRPWLQLPGLVAPELTSESALSEVGLSANISGAQQSWQIDGIDLRVDATSVSGSLALDEQTGWLASLEIDSLNLDDYLPVSEGVGNTASAAPQESPDTALDFGWLQDLRAEVLVSVAQLQAAGLALEDLLLSVEASPGSLVLRDLSGNLYQGHLQMTADLNTQGEQPVVTSAGQITGLEVQPLLAALAKEQRVNGAVNGKWQIKTRGVSVAAWQTQADGSVEATASSLEVQQIDLERSACELAALVNSEPIPEIAWKGNTPLRDFDLKATLQGENLAVKEMHAGVEGLALAGKGKFGIGSGEFEFPLDVMYGGEADATRKCQVRERWRNRLMPLRCKGSLENLSWRTCLPDHKRLDDILRDQAKDKAREKIKSRLEDKLGTETGEAVDHLLRELLKK